MKLGHDELLGELGRGGMGVVYRARDPLLGREVAIKVLQPQAADAEVMARFQREAQTASNLRHEGIVSVHAAGLERGRPYLVMDLVKGEALGNLGAVHQLRGDHARAVEALTRALELDAGLAVVRANRGISRGAPGDHRGAVEDCARALEALPAGSRKAREAQAALDAARAALGER